MGTSLDTNPMHLLMNPTLQLITEESYETENLALMNDMLTAEKEYNFERR